MKIVNKAQAGSFESSDILILIEPVKAGEGRKIELESTVYHQYGEELEALVIGELDKYEIQDIHLKANDKGAIDTVILARLETVLLRGMNQQSGTLY